VPIVKEVTAELINESPLDGIIDGWKKLSRSPFIKGREYLTITELSQCKKHTKYPHQVERSCKLEVLK
jgi:hypothetical protein